MYLHVSVFQIHYFTILSPVAFCSMFKEIECNIICLEILFSSDEFCKILFVTNGEDKGKR